MKHSELELEEEIRLADLYSFGILDTEEEEDFTHLMELAAAFTNCPMAAISFIDKDRQWFKAKKNLGLSETPRGLSFCTYTIMQEGVMLVPDTSKDDRFKKNPYVLGDPHISFYAGAPIRSHSGQKMGTVCVMDTGLDKELSRTQQDALMTIANQVSRLLELKRKNQSLISYTNKLIEAEKTLHRMAIMEEESERNFIAHQLHENFAQTLAATKLYIEFAETESDLRHSFLTKSKENIELIITEIQTLCNYIRPVNLNQANASFLIRDYVGQWAKTADINIEFSEDLRDDLPSSTGLPVYRILQNILPLAKTYRARKIELEILQTDSIDIVLRYKPVGTSSKDPSNLLLLKKSISLAQAESGRLYITRDGDGTHQVNVRIPLLQQAIA